jgi:hypothetical protein
MGIYFVSSASRARRIKSLTNAGPGREIGEPRFPRFASKPEVFPPKRRSKIGMIRGLSVENINDKTCESRNMIRGSAKGEPNGLPDQDEHSVGAPPSCPVNPFKGTRPAGEASSARGIERHALGGMWFCRLTLAFANEGFRSRFVAALRSARYSTGPAACTLTLPFWEDPGQRS